MAKQINKKLVISVISVMVLIAAGLLYYFFTQTKESNDTPPDTSQNLPSNKYGEQTNTELSEAQKAVDEADKSPQTVKEREALARKYINLAQAQYNVKAPADSVATYEKLMEDYFDSVKDSVLKRDMLSGLMYSYAQNDQRDKAIETCERLITYLKGLKNKDAYTDAKIQAYTNNLNALKAGQDI